MPKDNLLYIPIHVGAEGKTDIGYLKDNSGEHISQLNPYYCELTGLYWAWKNLDCDYLGLVHYRRYLTAKKQSYHSGINIDNVVLSQSDIEDLLDKVDVILPQKRRYYIETLYSHYAHTFESSHLDLARDIIKRNCPEYLASFDRVMKQRSGYMFNMFIMKKPLVDKYCQWLFPILDEMYRKIDLRKYTPFEARLFGRVSERLFNVWLSYEQLNSISVPFMYMEKVDLFKKGKSFLMAKLLGKKYKDSF